jgi:hypothetical protein
MSRPTAAPDWATNPNYPPGPDPWSSTPTRATPSAGLVQSGQTPEIPIPAELMNFLWGTHGDWIKYLDPLTGDMARALSVRDDFLGDRLNRSLWSPSLSNAIAQNGFDDSANGAAGALALNADTGAAWSALFQMAPFPLAGLNWRMSARVRFANWGVWAAAGTTQIGYLATDSAYFTATGAGGAFPNINAVINGTAHDLGVAPSASAYQLLEMICVAGTITVLIDGVVKGTFAYTAGVVTPTISALGTNTNDGSIDVDWFEARVDFYATTGTTLTPTPAHREEFAIAITTGTGAGHEYVDQSFASNFPDTLYDWDAVIEMSDDLQPNVGVTVRLKAIGSLRLRFDAAFNGTVKLVVKDQGT